MAFAVQGGKDVEVVVVRLVLVDLGAGCVLGHARASEYVLGVDTTSGAVAISRQNPRPERAAHQAWSNTLDVVPLILPCLRPGFWPALQFWYPLQQPKLSECNNLIRFNASCRVGPRVVQILPLKVRLAISIGKARMRVRCGGVESSLVDE